MEISIKNQVEAFSSFLEPEHNKRIIFSGPFGIGKTYFLNKFFEDKDDKYFAIKISPVNYSIGSNEDMFNYIRYVILYDLYINKKISLDEADTEKVEPDTLSFLYYNSKLLLPALFSFVPKIGKSVSDFVREAQLKQKEHMQNNKEYYHSLLDKVNEHRSLIEAHPQFTLDEIAQFIGQKISDNSGERKSILIIDDLDRIDPEHIFRLFNVFSAQFGDYDDIKLGFDKVIFVCDISNIRNIFEAKYGGKTDFNGYIDKFYSTAPYFFNNYLEVNNFIKRLEIKTNSKNYSEIISHKCLEWLNLVLVVLNSAGELNLRTLEKLNLGIVFQKFHQNLYSFFDGVYQVLKYIYNYDKDMLIQKLNNSKQKLNIDTLTHNYGDTRFIYSSLLAITEFHNHKNKRGKYDIEIENKTYSYEILVQSSRDGDFLISEFVLGESPKINMSDCYELMIKAIEIYIE